MKVRRLAGLGVSMTIVVAAATAWGGDVGPQPGKAGVFMRLQLSEAGTVGPYNENLKGKDYAGPGFEQPVAAYYQDTAGHVYLTSIFMSSKVSNEDRPWQLKCSTVRLSPGIDLATVVTEKQITKLGDPNNADERPANHPHMVHIPGTKQFLFAYGSDDNNGNTQTYVQTVDHMCEITSDMVRISNNNNNNQGAPECSVNACDGLKCLVSCGYYDNNGQKTYMRFLNVSQTETPTVEKGELKVVVTPSDIGRPAVTTEPDRTFVCAAKGDNRPPEDGVECTFLNATTGEILWKSYIAESEPNKDIYYNQPSVAKLAANMYAVSVVKSNGNGKKTNDKGTSQVYLKVVQVTDVGMQIMDQITEQGGYPVSGESAHASICSGMYGIGAAAKMHVGIMSASITGSGGPSVNMLSYDGQTKSIKFDYKNDRLVVGYYGDSGFLANIYGQNPNTQGRDFPRCVGSVPNPSYGLDKGFMPKVKSFFVSLYAGKGEGDQKNGGWLSLVPAEVAEALPPEPPKPVTPSVDGTPDDPCDDGQPCQDPIAPPTGSDPAPQGPTQDPSFRSPGSDSGCAVGRGGASWGALALGLAFAGLALRRRRRDN
jgi:MYXO-CTERM domain-containing protein